MKVLDEVISEEYRYRVVIGRGVFGKLGGLLEWSPSRTLIVYDVNAPSWGVEELSGSIPGATVLGVEGGEGFKTLESVLSLVSRMTSLGMDRSSLVIAYGGGSVSDTVGFAASIYMRGLPWAVAPTTMLGMVDASVGGKTGVNYGGKNIIGSFHHPRLVLVDTRVLDTLPDDEYRRGLAEVVKHAVIAGEGLLAWIEDNIDGISSRRLAEDLISMSLGVKLDIVSRDPREERGVREVLNLGHTVAHALERASGYRIPHGDAVSIGLVAELRSSEKLAGLDPGVRARVTEVLRRLGLPVSLPIPLEELAEHIRLDKKRRGDKIIYPLVYGPGKVEARPLPLDAVLEALKGG